MTRSAQVAKRWRKASLPAVEPGFQPGGTTYAHKITPQVVRAMVNISTVFSGRQDAALYGRQDACRYNA